MSMNRPAKCPILLLALVLAVSGCASAPSENAMSPSERRLKDSTEDFRTTVATGAIVGTVIGAVLGVALAVVSRGSISAAGIGAGLGALGGTGAGYYIATRNSYAADREAALNGRIDAAQKEISNYREIAFAAEAVATEQRAKLAALDAYFRKGEISAAQYRRDAQNARFAQERMRKALDNARAVDARLRDDLATAPSWKERTFRGALEELQQLRHSLALSQASLAQALAGVPG